MSPSPDIQTELRPYCIAEMLTKSSNGTPQKATGDDALLHILLGSWFPKPSLLLADLFL